MPDAKGPSVLVRSPGLGRGFGLSGPPERVLYLRPAGLLAGVEARAAAAEGIALPLAGGPVAFTLCEVMVRRNGRVETAVASLAELREWALRERAKLEPHLARLLEACSAPRPSFTGLALDRPRLMAVVNATPDSFSDRGEHLAPADAVARGRVLAEAGADIIDVGGESTRPGGAPVDAKEELRRVRPVLEGLAGCGAVLSIDTRHAAVMTAALELGALIINDVTALTGDPKSLALAASRRAHVVLVHMQGEPRTMNRAPRYSFAPLDVYDALAARVEACVAAGIPRARIAVDPGLGFGKATAHNLAILERLALFHGLGCAVLVGASRKLLVGASRRDTPPKARLGASLGAALAALERGAQLLRVHDLAETRQAVDMWRAVHENC